MSENKILDQIPESFATLEEASDFWDSHDLGDYWHLTEEVKFEVDLQSHRYLFAIAPELVNKLTLEARKRGLSIETLINLWLSEKLQTVMT
jgi:hypothetical protein